MSDTIYRQDVINALEELSASEEYGVEIGTDEETYIGKYEAITAISDLPSVDRPQGEWIWGNEKKSWHKCSVCGESAYSYYDELADDVEELFDYCPNCGARMKGADDESG